MNLAKMNHASQWLYFAGFQVVCAALMVLGWVILLPAAACKFWEPAWSVHYPGSRINVWKWRWLDAIWGNDEDGVTGAPFYQAQFADERVRAYMWTAWRNSTNNMRWASAIPGGVFIRWTSKSRRRFQMGFRPGDGWPVFRPFVKLPPGAT